MAEDFNVRTLPPEFLPAPEKKKNFLWLMVGAAIVLVLGGGVGAYFYLVRKNAPALIPPPVVETPSPVPPPAALVPEPVPAPAPEPPPVEPTPPQMLQVAPDSDGDGLTDDEEILYKTDVHNPDTDADNFIDGNEVFKLYSPIASGNAQLVDSGLVKVFNNNKQQYSIFYLDTFSLDILDATSTTKVSFTAPTGEKFIVTVMPNSAQTSPLNYYLAAHPEVPITAISAATSRGGYSGIGSADGLETILDGKNGLLYSFVYDVGGNTLKRFTTTYHMMINSFKLSK